MIRHVLIKDFSYFEDRMNIIKSESDKNSLGQNALSSKNGDEWRRVRNAVTPAFTSGKMKKIIPIFNQCSKELCDYLESYVKEQKEIPLKEVMNKHAMNIIAKCAFSVEINAFQGGEETPFLREAKKMFEAKFFDPRIMFMMAFPNVAAKIQEMTGYQIFKNSTNVFFKNILGDLLDQRREDKNASEKYCDFFQILLNSLDEGSIIEEDKELIHDQILNQKSKRNITRIEILAQAFVFLVAGYETVALTLHIILYIITKLPEIQNRLRDEISEVLNNKVNLEHDDIAKLNYMNQVICEAMRMYPAATRTNRVCTKPITINGIEFNRSFTFSVPIYAVHYHEKYFPNPHEFDPERFSPQEKAKRDPLAFMPFGHGPRNCIGMRFAEFEMRVTLVNLLQKYEFFPASESPDLPLKMDSRGLFKPEQTLYVRARNL